MEIDARIETSRADIEIKANAAIAAQAARVAEIQVSVSRIEGLLECRSDVSHTSEDLLKMESQMKDLVDKVSAIQADLEKNPGQPK